MENSSLHDPRLGKILIPLFFRNLILLPINEEVRLIQIPRPLTPRWYSSALDAILVRFLLFVLPILANAHLIPSRVIATS